MTVLRTICAIRSDMNGVNASSVRRDQTLTFAVLYDTMPPFTP